jgi:hypothetical protein
MCICSYGLCAQIAGIPPPGPISMSLSGISAPLSNSWSIFNNPAGLAEHEALDVVFAYQTIFDFAPFNTSSAAINIPSRIGNTSIGAYRFGDDLFSTSMLSLGYASTIGIISLGAKFNYLQYSIDGFGKKAFGIGEIGVIADLSPALNFGMHIYNFTQTKVDNYSGEVIPVVIRLALHYQLGEKVNLYLEGEKDIEAEEDIKFGLSYQIIGALQVRTGISTITNRMTFGAGLELSRFVVDYALSANETISTTHNFGLTYRLKN